MSRGQGLELHSNLIRVEAIAERLGEICRYLRFKEGIETGAGEPKISSSTDRLQSRSVRSLEQGAPHIVPAYLVANFVENLNR